MRILYYGATPLATPPLEALIAAGHSIVAVVTQPNPAGSRGPETVAGAWRIPVLQPSVLDEGTVANLRERAPEAQVVIAYPLPIPPGVVALAPKTTVKIHASLLPRNRGAAPIPWAILRGETETGVTAVQLDASGADTGAVLGTRTAAIGEQENAGELTDKLAKLAAELAVETLAGLAAGTLTPKAQDRSGASDAPAVGEDEGWIDWKAPADMVARRIRAFQPWPGPKTRLGGSVIEILRAGVGTAGGTGTDGGMPAPGTVLKAAFDGILVACDGGTVLNMTLVRPDDQRPMSPSAFIRRFGSVAGIVLGRS